MASDGSCSWCSLPSTSQVKRYFLSQLAFTQIKTVTLSPDNNQQSSFTFAVIMGLVNWIVRLCVLGAFFGYYAPDRRLYEAHELITGATRSWIGAGELYNGQRDFYWQNTSFCNDTRQYWYASSACDTDSANFMSSSSTGCEYDITCSYPNYATATQKRSEEELHIFTYLKETTYRQVPCSVGKSACSENEHFWNGDPFCKCWKTSNQFLIGVEQMTFNVKHEFDQLRRIGPTDKRFSKDMLTRIRRGSIDGEVLATFKPEDNISQRDIAAPVGDWLVWAGVEHLDMSNRLAFEDYPPIHLIPGSNNKPTFRMTGVEILVEANYKGSVGLSVPFYSQPIECDLVVSHRGGYHSFGSHPTILGLGGEVVSDRYLRGVNFKLSSRGKIGEISFYDALVNLVVVITYFKMIPYFVELCMYLLPRAMKGCLDCCMLAHKHKIMKFLDYFVYETHVWRDKATNVYWSIDKYHVRYLLHAIFVKMVFRGKKEMDEGDSSQSIELGTKYIEDLIKDLIETQMAECDSLKVKPVEIQRLADFINSYVKRDRKRHGHNIETPMSDRMLARLLMDSDLTFEECLNYVNNAPRLAALQTLRTGTLREKQSRVLSEMGTNGSA